MFGIDCSSAEDILSESSQRRSIDIQDSENDHWQRSLPDTRVSR